MQADERNHRERRSGIERRYDFTAERLLAERRNYVTDRRNGS